ncbi:MAG TPA: type III secretion system chaperone [Candidatus Eremiobacteraceae bacterium]|nr:type III secretion system chaperone [Candidatus Eremiobacteraceae bacterium]
MEKTPRAQELNAHILRLARDKGALADKDLHALLAVEYGVAVSAQPIASVDHMLFSANVNLAKRRLVRYGLLSLDAQKHISITAQGELFLARAFTRLDARVRRCLDDAWLNIEVPVQAASVAGERAERASEEDEGSPLHELLCASNLEFHDLDDGGALVPVWSRLRSWIVDLRESNGWICLRTHVMALPDKPAARMAVIDTAMRANSNLMSWRFSLGPRSQAIFLEAECRADQLDGDDLAGIIALLRSTAEEQYEALLKIALAPSPLDALEAAFKRSA